MPILSIETFVYKLRSDNSTFNKEEEEDDDDIIYTEKQIRVICHTQQVSLDVDRYASAAWTTDGRPKADEYPSAGKVHVASL